MSLTCFKFCYFPPYENYFISYLLFSRWTGSIYSEVCFSLSLCFSFMPHPNPTHVSFFMCFLPFLLYVTVHSFLQSNGNPSHFSPVLLLISSHCICLPLLAALSLFLSPFLVEVSFILHSLAIQCQFTFHSKPLK